MPQATSPTGPSSTPAGRVRVRATTLGGASAQTGGTSQIDPAERGRGCGACSRRWPPCGTARTRCASCAETCTTSTSTSSAASSAWSSGRSASTRRPSLLDERAGRARPAGRASSTARAQRRCSTSPQERRAILERLAELTAEEAKAAAGRRHRARGQARGGRHRRDIERAAHGARASRGRATSSPPPSSGWPRSRPRSPSSRLVRLPGDDMKGRIIGREGRNIRSFEQTTGVNLIIDDTPEAVVLSCFDPVRREVGRITLEELVADGRIHPSRIEEVYHRSLAEIDRLCQRAGEDALMEVGVTDVHPHLVFTLGQLRYRTSYGQSVLKHCVESAHAAGLLAAELGVDGTVGQAGGAAARHRQGAHPRGGGQPCPGRRRARPSLRRVRRHRARDRGPPQRGRAAHASRRS